MELELSPVIDDFERAKKESRGEIICENVTFSLFKLKFPVFQINIWLSLLNKGLVRMDFKIGQFVI